EVAEGRQSHWPVAADTHHPAPCRSHSGRGPANESGRTKDSYRDEDLSSSPNIRKPRTGRSAGAAEGRPAGAETGRTASDYQLSLAGGPHRQRCLPRRGKARALPVAGQETSD